MRNAESGSTRHELMNSCSAHSNEISEAGQNVTVQGRAGFNPKLQSIEGLQRTTEPHIAERKPELLKSSANLPRTRNVSNVAAVQCPVITWGFLSKLRNGTGNFNCCAGSAARTDQRVSTWARNAYPQFEPLCLDPRSRQENQPSETSRPAETTDKDYTCHSCGSSYAVH